MTSYKVYRICKKVVEEGNQLSGGERVLYQKKHSQKYQLHDFEKEELQRLGFIKIPSAEKLIFELEKLKSQESFEKEN